MDHNCTVCGQQLAASKAGIDAHMKRYHGVQTRYIPMDPFVKARIIAKVESRLFRHMIPSPENWCEHCGLTENPGFHRPDGAFLCEPCLTIRARKEIEGVKL